MKNSDSLDLAMKIRRFVHLDRTCGIGPNLQAVVGIPGNPSFGLGLSYRPIIDKKFHASIDADRRLERYPPIQDRFWAENGVWLSMMPLTCP
jgi:hypothetical protein